MEASLTHEAFAQHANTRFRIETDQGAPLELELIEVSELKSYPEQEEFAIVFRGPLNVFLGQGIRMLAHEHMGEFEIFLVPIRQDDDGFYYEAVFNRLRDLSPQ